MIKDRACQRLAGQHNARVPRSPSAHDLRLAAVAGHVPDRQTLRLLR